MQSADNLLDVFQFVGLHFTGFVEQNNVAELNLLDNKILNVFFTDVLFCQVIAVGKFIAHTQGVDHSDDAVQDGYSAFAVFGIHRRNGADSLGYRCRFTNAARLNDDIVKPPHSRNVVKLLNQIHLKCAANATVLQCNQTVILLSDDATLLNKARVNVDFTDIIDNDGKLNAFLVGEYSVQQRRFATAEITCKQ